MQEIWILELQMIVWKIEYDDYHGYYCNETVLVYVGGTEYYCDADDLDDLSG